MSGRDDLTEEQRARIREEVSAWPPLSGEQLLRLAALLTDPITPRGED